jgi:quercetin dioxygenase-like cupin family protein
MSHSPVLHYTWDSLIPDHPMALVSRRRLIGEQAMISHVTLDKGCHVSEHSHENEQFVCVLSGALRFVLAREDGQYEECVVSGGEVLHLLPNVPHAADVLEDSVVLDVFSPPSATTGIDSQATADE